MITFLGFAVATPSVPSFALLFGLAGVYIAAEDTLERGVTGSLTTEGRRGIAFGALATMNGVGDLVSSITIGVIFSLAGYAAGFALAATVGALGDGPSRLPPRPETAEVTRPASPCRPRKPRAIC